MAPATLGAHIGPFMPLQTRQLNQVLEVIPTVSGAQGPPQAGGQKQCTASQAKCKFSLRCCVPRCRNGERRAVHHVLNECLVDRGSSPAMVTLQLSADRHHITTVQVGGAPH